MVQTSSVFWCAGEYKLHREAAMRQAHSTHVLRELAHQQGVNIGLMTAEIARLTQRTRASFTSACLEQPDNIKFFSA